MYKWLPPHLTVVMFVCLFIHLTVVISVYLYYIMECTQMGSLDPEAIFKGIPTVYIGAGRMKRKKEVLFVWCHTA